jgi:hypothetical protein
MRSAFFSNAASMYSARSSASRPRPRADYEDALRTAARAIADTDRPVGLVMWRGRTYG